MTKTGFDPSPGNEAEAFSDEARAVQAIGVADSERSGPVAEVIGMLGARGTLSDGADPAASVAAALDRGQGPVLVLYEPARAFAARMTRSGRPIAQTLDAWMRLHAPLGSLVRRRHAQGGLHLAAAAALRSPAGASLLRTLGLPELAAGTAEDGGAGDPLELVVIDRAILNRPNVDRLDGLLEASAMPCPGTSFAEDAPFEALRRRAEAIARHAAAERDRDRWRETARRLEADLAEAREALGTRDDRIAELEEEVTSERAFLELQAAHIAEMRDDAHGLHLKTARLHELEETLRRLERERDEAREGMARVEHDLQGSRTQVDDMMTSTSWRVTSPIRRVKLALSGGKRDD